MCHIHLYMTHLVKVCLLYKRKVCLLYKRTDIESCSQPEEYTKLIKAGDREGIQNTHICVEIYIYIYIYM